MRRSRSLFVRAVASLRNRLSLLGGQGRALELQALHQLGLVEVGRHPFVGRSVRFTIYGDLVVGDNVLFDDGCHVYVSPNARVVLGNNVRIGRNSVVVATESIEIGDHVLIAEHCTIRDSDHQLRPEDRRHETSVPHAPVVIGADSWIGSGVRILKGSQIGAGAVIGANAVVRGLVPSRSVAVGIPARVIRTIE
jgi:acetyltransferase-like isoleucine patch superfamily enzyme